MRIGVEATTWQNKRGYGRFTRSLLNALVRSDANNQYTFIADTSERMESIPSEVEVRLVQTSRPTITAASSQGSRSISDMYRMSKVLSSEDADILLFPTVYSYVPVFTQAKKILIIHDVIVEKYPHHTIPSRKSRLFWRMKVAFGRYQADAIVTVSEYSKKGIVEYFNISPNRISVIGEASDPQFRVIENAAPTEKLSSLKITGEGTWITYVGGFGPHKNLSMLVSCFDKLTAFDEFDDVRLLMVGEFNKEVFHSSVNELQKQIETLGLKDRVIFTGYLADEDLVVLLNLSTVFVLPSLIEGFGLPAIEAAACGCPIIATIESPLPDLLGDGGLFIDPHRPDQLETALRKVIGSKEVQDQLRQAGVQAAQKLTWDKSAQQMLGIIDQLLQR